jgi:C-terminal processing protease CtpA/Prc
MRARAAAWTGELVVLTNRRTASASEDFAASLQDAGAATLAGEATMGIGCGYTDGGVTLELPATGLTVKAPDCIRYRKDGRNEAEGVLPDLPIAWADGDSGKVRAEKVLAALPR